MVNPWTKPRERHRRPVCRRKEGKKHRVDRVPGFLFSRPKWLPPVLHPQAGVAPPPFVSKGRRTHSLGGEGAGETIPTKGQTLWYSRYSVIHHNRPGRAAKFDNKLNF